MNVASAGTFLPPIENPQGLMMKLVYAMTRRQFGKVLTPLKVFSARMPLAFGLFSAKIGKLDKKLMLPPETAMLIREQVARINVCLFCIDIGRSFAIKASMNEAKFDALEQYAHQPSFHRSGTRGAGLCDRADQRQKGRPEHVCAHVQPLFRTRDLRDRLAGGQRTFLQHDQYRPEHPFGHALRHQQEKERSMRRTLATEPRPFIPSLREVWPSPRFHRRSAFSVIKKPGRPRRFPPAPAVPVRGTLG